MKASVSAVLYAFLLLTQSVHGTSENEKFSYWNTFKDTVYGLSQDECIQLGVKTAGVAAVTMVAAPVVLSAAGFGAAAATVAVGAKFAILGGSLNSVSCALWSAFQSEPRDWEQHQGASKAKRSCKSCGRRRTLILVEEDKHGDESE